MLNNNCKILRPRVIDSRSLGRGLNHFLIPLKNKTRLSLLMSDIQDEQDIKVLVHSFYDKVQNDKRLGYIFNDVAQVNWDTHLSKMVSFWSNLLFQTGRYTGRPFRQHIPLPIKEGDFDRWYGLFEETVDKNFRGEKATLAKELARNIASSFELRMEKGGLLNQKEE